MNRCSLLLCVTDFFDLEYTNLVYSNISVLKLCSIKESVVRCELGFKTFFDGLTNTSTCLESELARRQQHGATQVASTLQWSSSLVNVRADHLLRAESNGAHNPKISVRMAQ